jgi:hypothetical protein
MRCISMGIQWTRTLGHEGQSLLEAVGHLEAQQGVTSGDVEHNDDADMREVFGLPAQ